MTIKLTRLLIEEQFKDEDGYWVYLKPGYKNALDPIGNLHIIHEDTKRECFQESVLRCDCDDCAELIRKAVEAGL